MRTQSIIVGAALISMAVAVPFRSTTGTAPENEVAMMYMTRRSENIGERTTGMNVPESTAASGRSVGDVVRSVLDFFNSPKESTSMTPRGMTATSATNGVVAVNMTARHAAVNVTEMAAVNVTAMTSELERRDQRGNAVSNSTDSAVHFRAVNMTARNEDKHAAVDASLAASNLTRRDVYAEIPQNTTMAINMTAMYEMQRRSMDNASEASLNSTAEYAAINMTAMNSRSSVPAFNATNGALSHNAVNITARALITNSTAAALTDGQPAPAINITALAEKLNISTTSTGETAERDVAASPVHLDSRAREVNTTISQRAMTNTTDAGAAVAGTPIVARDVGENVAADAATN